MIDLKAIADQISDMDWQHVGDVVEAADAMTNDVAPVPAAYISTAREQALPNRNSTGRHSQMVMAQISVLCAIGAQRADAQLTDEVEERRDQIIDRLMGWTPTKAALPLDYVSYSVRFMDQGTVWFELLFATKYLRSKDAA
jgi:nitrous oxide reductase